MDKNKQEEQDSHPLMRKHYFLWSLFFAGLLALACSSYTAAFYLKAVIQFFATGKSPFKDYFFLVWAAASFFLLSFPAPSKTHAPIKLLLVLMAALAALNTLSHVILVHRTHLNFAERVLAVSEEAASSHIFSHTHTMKPMLMPFVEALHLESLSHRTDPGGPYYSLLPRGLFYGGIPLVLILIVCIGQTLRAKEQEWNSSIRWGCVFLFIVSSFAVVKSFFDGGSLSAEFITYAPIFVALLLTKQTNISGLGREFVFCLGLSASVGALAYALIKPNAIVTLLRLIGILYPFPALVFLTAGAVSNRKWKWSPAIILTFSILAWNAQNYFWALTFKIVHPKLTEKSVVYFMNPDGDPYPYPVFGKEGKLIVYKLSGLSGTRVEDLYARHNIPATYDRIKVGGGTCSEEMSDLSSGKLKVIEGTLSREFQSPLLESFKLIPDPSGATSTFLYNAKINDCLPNGNEELLYNHLHEMGFKRFLMIPDNQLS